MDFSWTVVTSYRGYDVSERETGKMSHCVDCGNDEVAVTEESDDCKAGMCWLCAMLAGQTVGGASGEQALTFCRGFVKAVLACGPAHLLDCRVRPDWVFVLSRSMAPDKKVGLNRLLN